MILGCARWVVALHEELLCHYCFSHTSRPPSPPPTHTPPALSQYCIHTNSYNDLMRFSVLQRGNGVVAKRLLLLAADSVDGLQEDELEKAPRNVIWKDVDGSICERLKECDAAPGSGAADHTAVATKPSSRAKDLLADAQFPHGVWSRPVPKHHKVVNCRVCLRYRNELNRWHQHKAKIAVQLFKLVWLPILPILYTLMAVHVVVLAVKNIPSMLVGFARSSFVCLDDIGTAKEIVKKAELDLRAAAKTAKTVAADAAAAAAELVTDLNDKGEQEEKADTSSSSSSSDDEQPAAKVVVRGSPMKKARVKKQRKVAMGGESCTELRDIRKLTTSQKRELALLAAEQTSEDVGNVGGACADAADHPLAHELARMKISVQSQLDTMQKAQEKQMVEIRALLAAVVDRTSQPQPQPPRQLLLSSVSSSSVPISSTCDL